MCFLEVQGTAEDVVTMLVMVSCLVEGVIGAWRPPWRDPPGDGVSFALPPLPPMHRSNKSMAQTKKGAKEYEL